MRVGCCGVGRHTSDAGASWWLCHKISQRSAGRGKTQGSGVPGVLRVTMEAGLLPL